MVFKSWPLAFRKLESEYYSSGPRARTCLEPELSFSLVLLLWRIFNLNLISKVATMLARTWEASRQMGVSERRS